LLYALGSMATLLMMCDRRDLGTAVGERPPSAATEINWEDFAATSSNVSEVKEFFEPNLYIYDAYPGGIGFSEPLYRSCHTLLNRTLELISACLCENGCPSCVGPTADRNERTKKVALEIVGRLSREMAMKTAESA
jgi:DEAD/DEAH box helicase domain-containing protein